MLNKLKEMYCKYNAKNLEKYTYTKYKIQIDYKNGTIKEWIYDKYCSWNKSDVLKWEVIDDKCPFEIEDGIATPVSDIEKIQAIPLDKVDLYFFKESISDFPYPWISEEDIKKQQDKWKNEIKYIKEDK